MYSNVDQTIFDIRILNPNRFNDLHNEYKKINDHRIYMIIKYIFQYFIKNCLRIVQDIALLILYIRTKKYQTNCIITISRVYPYIFKIIFN